MKNLVSIIIPTYNRVHDVKRAIDSALSQTHQSCEVIVVDDGSTDTTPDLLNQYGQRIVAIRQSNQGRSVARNAGFTASHGEYMVFLDSDDALLPEMVKTLLDYFRQHPQSAFVYGRAWMTNMQGRPLTPPILMGAPLNPSQPPFLSLVMGQSLLIHTVLIKRTALESVGCFEVGLDVSEDWDLWLRLAARYDVGYVPNVVALCANELAGGVERLARYNVQQQTPYIIERAFTYLPADSPLHSLRPRAIARALIQWGGCVEFALQNKDSSLEYLRQAQNEYPELLSDMEVIPRGVAQFATWYQADGIAFIRNFFKQLPPDFSAWRALQNTTLALYYAKQSQLAWHQKRFSATFISFCSACFSSPPAFIWSLVQLWRRKAA